MAKKIAIIGASIGQLPIAQKAKAMGLIVYCFAWSKDAICRDYVDYYFDISIFEIDAIERICRENKIDGIISNASDITAEIVSILTTRLGLPGILYNNFAKTKDKYEVRNLTSSICGLSKVEYKLYSLHDRITYPCIVKPCTGSAKRGVSFAKNAKDLQDALEYAKQYGCEKVLIEQYIDGMEISVETISFNNVHYIVQITEKETTGIPHFVEIAHHQPAKLNPLVTRKILDIIPQILSKLHFNNCASHIEMKISKEKEIFLIEVNPRGGGDEISNYLVELSTGYDYLKAMIQVSLGETPNLPPDIELSHDFAGIYFLCKQTIMWKPFFIDSEKFDWVVRKQLTSDIIKESTSNYDRNGYIIYKYSQKINLNSISDDGN